MIRVGVVGLGMMGSMHIGAYHDIKNAELAAICDKDPARAGGDLSGAWSNLGEGGGDAIDMSVVKGTTELADLLAMEDLDLVDICVPTPFHAEVVPAALASGKHVICEKTPGPHCR